MNELQKELNLPSPIQPFEFPDGTGSDLKLFLKRDDLIHPIISGNKWRKLKLNLLKAKQQKFEQVLSFGGAFSNHIHALAFACNKVGLKSIGIIRGEEVDLNNPTLSFALEQGMKLKRISRSQYRLKNEASFIQDLRDEFGPFYLIPEGGSNYLGVEGCMKILLEPSELAVKPDYIATSIGTGTTISGMLASNINSATILGFTPFKNGNFLQEEIKKLLFRTYLDHDFANEKMSLLELVVDYHFGGFGKVKPALFSFVDELSSSSNIDFDLVYNGKMMYGLYQMIKEGRFKPNSTILILHCGGVQGNKGFVAH